MLREALVIILGLYFFVGTALGGPSIADDGPSSLDEEHGC